MTATDSDRFSWERLGDLQAGRPNLGMDMPVSVYRVMQYTLRDVLAQRYGPEQAGHVAGAESCRLEVGCAGPRPTCAGCTS